MYNTRSSTVVPLTRQQEAEMMTPCEVDNSDYSIISEGTLGRDRASSSESDKDDEDYLVPYDPIEYIEEEFENDEESDEALLQEVLPPQPTIPWNTRLYNICWSMLSSSLVLFFMLGNFFNSVFQILNRVICYKLIDPLLDTWAVAMDHDTAWVPSADRRQRIGYFVTIALLLFSGASLCNNVNSCWNLLFTKSLQHPDRIVPDRIINPPTTTKPISPFMVFEFDNSNYYRQLVDRRLETLEEIERETQELELKLNAVKQAVDHLYRSIQKISAMNGNDLEEEEYLVKLLLPIVEDAVTRNMKDVVEQAIHRYHHDVLNTADYALITRSAGIIYSFTSSTYSHVPAWIQSVLHTFALPAPVGNSPELAISPQTHAGECWSMYGDHGSLGIRLSEPIKVEAITVEYTSPEISHNYMDTAPREMELFGVAGYPWEKSEKTFVSLGTFVYDIKKPNSIQTFKLGQENSTIGFHSNDAVFHAVLLNIYSNYGSKKHTDIYRVRVHGTPATTN